MLITHIAVCCSTGRIADSTQLDNTAEETASEAAAAAEKLLLVHCLSLGRTQLWLTAHVTKAPRMPIALDVSRHAPPAVWHLTCPIHALLACAGLEMHA